MCDAFVETMANDVVWHIPHASTFIPERCRGEYCADLEQELLKMTDWFADDLFDLPGDRLVFPVSRLVCDVERFRDDRQERMAQIGMGAVYTACHDLALLRCVTDEQKEQILRVWYDGHHAALTDLVRSKLDTFGDALVVDCHSFQAIPLPYEPDRDPLRPDICIGTDPFHTPECLARDLETEFSDRGYRVERNRPFAGALVPLQFYQIDKRVQAVMIEVNRGLYMLENGARSDRYEKIKSDIRSVLEAVLRAFPCV